MRGAVEPVVVVVAEESAWIDAHEAGEKRRRERRSVWSIREMCGCAMMGSSELAGWVEGIEEDGREWKEG